MGSGILIISLKPSFSTVLTQDFHQSPLLIAATLVNESAASQQRLSLSLCCTFIFDGAVAEPRRLQITPAQEIRHRINKINFLPPFKILPRRRSKLSCLLLFPLYTQFIVGLAYVPDYRRIYGFRVNTAGSFHRFHFLVVGSPSSKRVFERHLTRLFYGGANFTCRRGGRRS